MSIDNMRHIDLILYIEITIIINNHNNTEKKKGTGVENYSVFIYV